MFNKTSFEKDSPQVTQGEETKHFVIQTFWMYMLCFKDNLGKFHPRSDEVILVKIIVYTLYVLKLWRITYKLFLMKKMMES